MTTPEKSIEEIVEDVASVCDKVEFLHGVPVKLPCHTKALLRGKVREVIKAERQKLEEAVEAEGEMIKRHITEWDHHSRSDAEFAGNVRHYFRVIIFNPNNK
jgi:hypothetical protein